MKKLLAILAVSAAVVACNNAGENKNTTDTTAAPTVDTATMAPAPVDTAAPMVDTMHHDTTATH